MALTQLIRERGFDRYQTGLRARFCAYGLEYTLTYCPPSDDTAMRLDFESPLHIGRVTVWESGLCDLEVLDVATGKSVLWQHREFANEDEFHSGFPLVPIFMRDSLPRQEQG